VCVTKSKKLEDWGGKREYVSSYKYIETCTKCGQVWCYVSKQRDWDRIPYLNAVCVVEILLKGKKGK